MGTVDVYLGLATEISDPAALVIGVDHGALLCARNKVRMILALGDFDSVNSMELEAIKGYADQVISLPSHKNQTDSEALLPYLENYERINMYGGLGGRLDHELINLELCKRDSRLHLWNKTNHIFSLGQGRYSLEREDCHYLSILALEPSVITTEQVLYPVVKRSITTADLYLTSNEFVDQDALITVHSGRILVLITRD